MNNCIQQEPFEIFLGDQKVMPLRIAYQSGVPVDLTNCTEIVANLPKPDGTSLQLKLSTGEIAITSPATTGQIAVTISAANSALLNVGDAQDIDVTFTISAEPITVRFYQALSVFEVA